VLAEEALSQAQLVGGIIVAAITAGGAVAAAYISSRTRKENQEQHGVSVEKLGELTGEVRALVGRFERTDGKLDEVSERVAVIEAYVGDQKVGTHDRRLEIHIEPLTDPPPAA
jgi:hypothetical protein